MKNLLFVMCAALFVSITTGCSAHQVVTPAETTENVQEVAVSTGPEVQETAGPKSDTPAARKLAAVIATAEEGRRAAARKESVATSTPKLVEDITPPLHVIVSVPECATLEWIIKGCAYLDPDAVRELNPGIDNDLSALTAISLPEMCHLDKIDFCTSIEMARVVYHGDHHQRPAPKTLVEPTIGPAGSVLARNLEPTSNNRRTFFDDDDSSTGQSDPPASLPAESSRPTSEEAVAGGDQLEQDDDQLAAGVPPTSTDDPDGTTGDLGSGRTEQPTPEKKIATNGGAQTSARFSRLTKLMIGAMALLIVVGLVYLMIQGGRKMHPVASEETHAGQLRRELRREQERSEVLEKKVFELEGILRAKEELAQVVNAPPDDHTGWDAEGRDAARDLSASYTRERMLELEREARQSKSLAAALEGENRELREKLAAAGDGEEGLRCQNNVLQSKLARYCPKILMRGSDGEDYDRRVSRVGDEYVLGCGGRCNNLQSPRAVVDHFNKCPAARERFDLPEGVVFTTVSSTASLDDERERRKQKTA